MAATTREEFAAQGGVIDVDCGISFNLTSTDSVSGACPKVITRTYTVTLSTGASASCEQILTVGGVFASGGIVWMQPLARNGANEDTDPGAGGTLKYRFKTGSTIPITVRVLGCDGSDMLAQASVSGTVQVFGVSECDGISDGNELPIDFNGVGESGGAMEKVGGTLKFNLDTKKLPTSFQCFIARVTITDLNSGERLSEYIPLQSK